MEKKILAIATYNQYHLCTNGLFISFKFVLKAFEADIFSLIGSLVEFKEVKVQKKMRTDIARIRKSNEVIWPSDKTRNLYAMEKDQYRRLLQENITKNYKHAPEAAYDDVNGKVQVIATDLKIADRVDVLALRRQGVVYYPQKADRRTTSAVKSRADWSTPPKGSWDK